MSVAKRDLEDNRKVTTHRLIEMKQRGEKISMLTAYDYSMAQLIDQAGMDVILVGDSASNVMAGNVTTLPITLDQMIYHGKSVMKAVKRALVVVDLPFGTNRICPELINRLRRQSQMSHDRNTRTQNTFDRFPNFRTSFKLDTIRMRFLHHTDSRSQRFF